MRCSSLLFVIWWVMRSVGGDNLGVRHLIPRHLIPCVEKLTPTLALTQTQINLTWRSNVRYPTIFVPVHSIFRYYRQRQYVICLRNLKQLYEKIRWLKNKLINYYKYSILYFKIPFLHSCSGLWESQAYYYWPFPVLSPGISNLYPVISTLFSLHRLQKSSSEFIQSTILIKHHTNHRYVK